MSRPATLDDLGQLRGLDVARLGLRWPSRKLVLLDLGTEERWHLTLSAGTPAGPNLSGTLDAHLTMEASDERVPLASIPFDVLAELGKDFEERFQVWLEKSVVAEMRPVSAKGLAEDNWRLALMFPGDFDRALGAVARKKRKRRIAFDSDALERLDDLPPEALVRWYERALHHPRCLSDLTAEERRGQVMAMRPVDGGVEMVVLVWAPNPDGVWHWWSMPLLTDLPAVFGELLFKPAFEMLSPYLADGLGRLVDFLERQAGFDPGDRLRALPAAMSAGVSWDEAQDLLEQPEEEESGASESNAEHDEAFRALWLKPARRSIERPERNEADDKKMR